MFNPVIVYRKGPLPPLRRAVFLCRQRRARRHRDYQGPVAGPCDADHVKNFTGWTAQIIQHEVDHCNGILI